MTGINPADLLVRPLNQSSTLPSGWFTDPEVFELEREFIFSRTWQMVGAAQQVREPGAYFTCEVAGEPLIVVRGHDNALRTFSNVCRHKAALVAHGEGTRSAFRCSYHGWTYGLDGRLRGTPHFEAVECFDREAACLPSFRVEEWGAFTFLNLDPQASGLLETLGEIPGLVERYRLDALVPVSQETYEVACNWKVLALNGIDCYHCPTIHPETWCNYAETELMVRAEGTGGLALGVQLLEPAPFPRSGLNEWEQNHILSLRLFPNAAITLTPQVVVVTRYIPVSPERTVWSRFCYFDPSGKPTFEEVKDQYSGVRLKVLEEDIAVCEEIQKNLRSRYYRPGRLSVKREYTQYHVESRLREMLAQGLRERATESAVTPAPTQHAVPDQ